MYLHLLIMFLTTVLFFVSAMILTWTKVRKSTSLPSLPPRPPLSATTKRKDQNSKDGSSDIGPMNSTKSQIRLRPGIPFTKTPPSSTADA